MKSYFEIYFKPSKLLPFKFSYVHNGVIHQKKEKCSSCCICFWDVNYLFFGVLIFFGTSQAVLFCQVYELQIIVNVNFHEFLKTLKHFIFGWRIDKSKSTFVVSLGILLVSSKRDFFDWCVFFENMPG